MRTGSREHDHVEIGQVGGRLLPHRDLPVASGSLNGNAPSAWTPFSSGRTAAFAASTFAALRLTGRLGSGSLVAGCPSWPDRAVRVCSHWPLPRQKSRTPKFIGSFSRRSRELPG